MCCGGRLLGGDTGRGGEEEGGGSGREKLERRIFWGNYGASRRKTL